MTTYDYMYDVLKLRGTIDINFQQLMKLRDEGVPFVFGGFRCIERDDLILECSEALKLEEEISDIIHNGDKDAKQVMYVTDTWKWLYLVKEYSVDSRDGGIHFSNLVIYLKEEEEYDNL